MKKLIIQFKQNIIKYVIIRKRVPYGIGVIKTYSDELETEVEKREFNHIFSKENDANNMLELLIRNKVTPITLKDILKDFVLV